MYELYRSGLSYYNDHVGVIGPIHDYGGARLEAADRITQILPGIFNAYTHLHGALSAVRDENGRSFGDKSPSEIEAKAASLGEGLSPANREKLEASVQPYSVNDLMMISQKQLDFRKKVKAVSKTFAQNYDFTKKPDAYLKLKPNMSMKDRAKYYLLKELCDEVYRPDAEFEELSAAVSGFSPAKFQEKAERLAADPAFQRCVKAHPDAAFSVWKQRQIHAKASEQPPTAENQPELI